MAEFIVGADAVSKVSYFCSLSMVLALSVAPSAWAQPAGTQAVLVQSLRLSPGMSVSQVEELFGAPDTKSVRQGANRESWYYGGSVVFFLNEKVTAWSDNGSLSERQAMAKFQTQNDGDSEILYEGGWLNIWTPQESLSRNAVLDEIIQ